MIKVHIEYNTSDRNSLDKSYPETCRSIKKYFNDIIRNNFGDIIVDSIVTYNNYNYVFSVYMLLDTDKQFEIIARTSLEFISIEGYGELSQINFSTLRIGE